MPMQIGSAHILGSYTDWRESTVTLTSGVTRIIAANPNRLALGFSITTTVIANVSTNANMTLNKGWAIGNNQLPFVLTFRDWGAMVQAAWYGLSTSGTGTLFVAEFFEVDR